MDLSSLSAGSVMLQTSAGNAVAGSIAYDWATRTVTLTPKTTLGLGATHTATVTGGSAGDVEPHTVTLWGRRVQRRTRHLHLDVGDEHCAR
jgi:hypothetical protein